MKTEKARILAADWHADVAQGSDRSANRQAGRDAPTMADLFARYLNDHAIEVKKVSSVTNDQLLIEKRLNPVLGRRKVTEIVRAEIGKLHSRMSDTPDEANRCLALISKAFNLAELWGLLPDGLNPCRHLKKFAEKKRKRFLSSGELSGLDEVPRDCDQDRFVLMPPEIGKRIVEVRAPISRWAVAAIRLLVLMGARRSEILQMRWEWIDAANG